MEVIGMPGGAELIVILFIVGSPIAIILLGLVDVLRSEFNPSQNKLIWVLVTILIPILGTLLYWIIGRSQRVK